MFRNVPAVLTAFVATAMVGGMNMAAASGAPVLSSRHGAERFLVVGTSTRSGLFSVIASGFFTDGGTVNIFAPKPEVRLGAGTLRLRTKEGPGKFKFNKATCLLTITGRGTYRLNHGTGKYAKISSSGRFTTTGRAVYRRRANGTCASSHPLAFQAIVTLTGSATKG